MSSDKRPFRKAVRVWIVKGDKVLVGKKTIYGGNIYSIPGGGIEDGESMDMAVYKECLEEVGIQVKNIQSLGICVQYVCVLPNPERAKIYQGGEDSFFMATFSKKNNAVHGSEGDAMPYTWETPANAKKLLLSGDNKEFAADKIKALEKVEEYMKSHNKHSLENW